MQLRINMEVMDEAGSTKPTGGTADGLRSAVRPGRPVDTFGYSGYRTSAAFDSLLAKVIVHSSTASWTDVVQKAARALREFRIGGVETNIPFIQGFWRIPISLPTASLPVSSIAMLPCWSAQPKKSPGRCSLQPGRRVKRLHCPMPP